MNDRMHTVECSGASQSTHTYIEITWDTPVIYMIILKVTGKLLLPMCSDLMAPKAYTYPNGFSVSLSAFFPDDTGVAALIPSVITLNSLPVAVFVHSNQLPTKFLTNETLKWH